MHSAPAVSYPVGRSNFHGCILGLISLAGALAGMLWRHQVDPPAWRQWLFVATLLGTSVAAFGDWWCHPPCGTLQWDGRGWSLTTPATRLCGPLTVHVDLQWCLLLCLRADKGKREWLWLVRNGDRAPWNALRRALFAGGASGQAPEAGVDDQ